MSTTCICVLKSGVRKGQRCYAKAKVGQLCGRHTKCAKAMLGAFHEVMVNVAFMRTNKKTTERDPSSAKLQQYIAQSKIIPQNIKDAIDGTYSGNKDVERTSYDVHYIGKNSFYFTCESNLASRQIANLILKQSLSDTEYEASPGNGSFVYPTKDGLNELGVIGFESVIVDGKLFK
jgi:hypothetical protein